jgi:uncharacterized protein YacL
MRAVAWKIALICIVLCYPLSTALGRLVTWIWLTVQNNATPQQQAQGVRVGNLVGVGLAILIWLIAVISAMESTRADDATERRLGRFSLSLVAIASAGFLVAFIAGRLVRGIAPA